MDRENCSSYELGVKLRDDGIPQKHANSRKIRVIVEDVNDHPPTFQFPVDNNKTVNILWNQRIYVPISKIIATDKDIGENSMLSFMIISGNEMSLFEIDGNTGELYLKRSVRSNDEREYTLMILAQDNGIRPLEAQADLDVVIDFTNATFIALQGEEVEERWLIIGGVVGGCTFVFSIVVVAVILFLIFRPCRRALRPPPPKENIEWQQVVLQPVQEEGGRETLKEKTEWNGGRGREEPEKSVPGWRGSDMAINAKNAMLEANLRTNQQPDVVCSGNDGTIGKRLAQTTQWNDMNQGVQGLNTDPYRKPEFYTFCKVSRCCFNN